MSTAGHKRDVERLSAALRQAATVLRRAGDALTTSMIDRKPATSTEGCLTAADGIERLLTGFQIDERLV